MQLTVQKRIAAAVLGCSPKRVWLDEQRTEEIKEAITRVDIRALINKGLIQEKPQKPASRGHARKIATQRRKGRRKGKGTRKGIATSRLSKKEIWMNKVRLQRSLIKEMKDKNIVTTANHRKLYLLVKGGFFRSKRHVKLFIEEKDLAVKKEDRKPIITKKKA